jgi:hypothetical protein
MAGTEETMAPSLEEEADWEDVSDEAKVYTRAEIWSIVFPTLVVVSLVVTIIVGLVIIIGPDDQAHELEDLRTAGSFTLDGVALNGTPLYGPHVWAYNLTLADGDVLSLTYSSTGPPGGIQVRLQHPLHPSQVGPVEVHTSAVGANGSLEYTAATAGAYQVYFYHPGASRTSDDGDAHQYASVTYTLVVDRIGRH